MAPPIISADFDFLDPDAARDQPRREFAHEAFRAAPLQRPDDLDDVRFAGPRVAPLSKAGRATKLRAGVHELKIARGVAWQRGVCLTVILLRSLRSERFARSTSAQTGMTASLG